jgi:hypothetical protein
MAIESRGFFRDILFGLAVGIGLALANGVIDFIVSLLHHR